MIKRPVIVLFLLALSSCGVVNEFLNTGTDPWPQGTNRATAEMTIEEAYDNFKSQLEENDGISVIAELNHAQNAEAAGMHLENSRIIFFGNPEIGTRLMQRNQLAGLDLPLRVLFYEKDLQAVALFNSASYYERRYGFAGTAILDRISANLEEMVANAFNTPVVKGRSENISASRGIKTVQSIRNFEETYSALKNILEDHDEIKIITEIDHSANAEAVEMELRPTKLIVFGNPNMGTPLMQSAMSTGLDLPQKILVWEDEGGIVNISFNTSQFLQFRHGLKTRSTELERLSNALNDLAGTAGGLN